MSGIVRNKKTQQEREKHPEWIHADSSNSNTPGPTISQFMNLKNPPIGNLYVAEKRQSTLYMTLKYENARSAGEQQQQQGHTK